MYGSPEAKPSSIIPKSFCFIWRILTNST
jgi:hypothetical protein